MTLNPKKDFCENSGYRKAWADVADSQTFSAAVTAALIIQQQSLNNIPDMASAAAAAWRMEGAKQFMSILMNLAEVSPPAPEIKPGQNLTWGKT